MSKYNSKSEILEAMRTLIQDGESLVTEDYYRGMNPEAFQEFAEVNHFKLEDVVSVFEENSDYLDELFEQYPPRSLR